MFLLSRVSQIHDYCKKYIDKYYKHEAVFFDDIWELYEPEIKKWIDKKPGKWRFRIPKIKLVGALGLSDPAQIPDLITTKIIDAINAVERNIMWRLISVEFMPEKKKSKRL